MVQPVIADTIFVFTTPVNSAEEAAERIRNYENVRFETVIKQGNAYNTSVGFLQCTRRYWDINGAQGEILETIMGKKQGLILDSETNQDIKQNAQTFAPTDEQDPGWGKSVTIFALKEAQKDLDGALNAIIADPSCVQDVEASHLWFMDRYCYSMGEEVFVVKSGESLTALFLTITALCDDEGAVRALITDEEMSSAELSRRFSVDTMLKKESEEKLPTSEEVSDELGGLLGEVAKEVVVSTDGTVKSTSPYQKTTAVAPNEKEDTWQIVVDYETDRDGLRKQYKETKGLYSLLKLFWQGSNTQERVILRSVATDLKSSAAAIKTRYRSLQSLQTMD